MTDLTLRSPQAARKGVSPVKPIAVLHLRDTHEIGGPGKTILETFKAIDASRFRLHLGVFEARWEDGDTPFVKAALACGMPVHHIRTYNQYDPRVISRIADLIERLDIDIVHAHEVKSDVLGYLATRRRRVPILTTLHGWIGNRPKDRLMGGLDKQIVRRFDCVIAVSGAIRDQVVAAGVPPRAVRLLHNSIVVERYLRTGRSGHLTELIGRPLVHPVLCSIGRLSPEKGHADLLRALAVVAARGHKVTTVLAGDGSDRSNLASLVTALGLQDSVHFVGYVSDTRRILEESDLMVLPSHTEGLPNVVLEALVMEVPVLATRVGGTPEVIEDAVTGRLVEARAPEVMADAIVDFLSDPEPWRAMARRGRALVETSFNFEARTRKLEAIYAELVQA